MTIIVVEQSLNVAAGDRRPGRVPREGPRPLRRPDRRARRARRPRPRRVPRDGGRLSARRHLHPAGRPRRRSCRASSTGSSPWRIVLVYRSTKVVNFAVGQHGPRRRRPASSCARSTTTSRSGSSLAIAPRSSGPLYGAVVELVVVRRLFRAPRVIVLVATIGVAQLSLRPARLPSRTSSARGCRVPRSRSATVGRSATSASPGRSCSSSSLAPADRRRAQPGSSTGPRSARTVKAAAGDPDLARLARHQPQAASRRSCGPSPAAWRPSRSSCGRRRRAARSASQAVGAEHPPAGAVAAVVAGLDVVPPALVAAVAIGVGEALIRFNFIDQPGVIDARAPRRGARRRAAPGPPNRVGEARRRVLVRAPRHARMPERLRTIWWVRHLDRLALLVLLAGAVVAAAPRHPAVAAAALHDDRRASRSARCR